MKLLARGNSWRVATAGAWKLLVQFLLTTKRKLSIECGAPFLGVMRNSNCTHSNEKTTILNLMKNPNICRPKQLPQKLLCEMSKLSMVPSDINNFDEIANGFNNMFAEFALKPLYASIMVMRVWA